MSDRHDAATHRELVKQLKKSRTARGWSKGDVAAELGVSTVTVHNWETGNHTPSGRNRGKIREWIRHGRVQGPGARAVDWDSLQPCVKHKDELWKPRRVSIEIEDFGSADIEVSRHDQFDLFHMMLKAAEDADDIQ